MATFPPPTSSIKTFWDLPRFYFIILGFHSEVFIHKLKNVHKNILINIQLLQLKDWNMRSEASVIGHRVG